MILILAEKLEKLREFLMSDSESKTIVVGSIQTIIAKQKNLELHLLRLEKIEVLEGRC